MILTRFAMGNYWRMLATHMHCITLERCGLLRRVARPASAAPPPGVSAAIPSHDPQQDLDLLLSGFFSGLLRAFIHFRI